MMDKYLYAVGLICLLTAGCTMRQAGYTALGAGAGGGIGYSLHHDGKEAAIGALSGALTGNLAAQWQDKTEKTKHDKVYQEGYKQARVDVAVHDWETNTGRSLAKQEPKRLVSVMIPKREENNVIYDSQEVTVEDYR